MRWGDFIARTAVRRVVWTLVGIVLFALLNLIGLGDARAATTETQARQACNVAYSAAIAGGPGRGPVTSAPGDPEWSLVSCGWREVTSASTGNFYCRYLDDGSGPFNCGQFGWDTSAPACPGGAPRDPVTGECPKDCTQEPNIANRASRNAVAFCHNGCSYVQDMEGDGDVPPVCFNTADILKPAFCAASQWKPSGVACPVDEPDQSEEYDPNKNLCRSTGGGFSECVKPDGEHCVTGAKGTTLCWKLGETGEKMKGDGSEGGSRKEAPEQPTPPKGMENPTPNGPTTSTTINNTTHNTGGYSGTGNSGGQPGDTPGGGGPGGPGDGEDGDEDGPGAPGAGLGDVYEASDETLEGVYGAFQERIGNSPLPAAVDGFFAVSLSASCPTFTLSASDYWDAMTFDFHCQGAFADALSSAGYLVLAVFGFLAFRIAFY